VKKPLALLALVAISVAISGLEESHLPRLLRYRLLTLSGNGGIAPVPEKLAADDVTGIGSFDSPSGTTWPLSPRAFPTRVRWRFSPWQATKTGASLKDVETSEIQLGRRRATDYRTVAGVKATVITTKANSEEQSILAFFTKNGVVYEVKFGCKNENFSGEKGAIDLV